MSERITLKKRKPNPLFEEWLQDLYKEAVEKDSKLKNMLKDALTSISKYPLPLQSGADCAILQGFGKKLCLFIDQKLEVYKTNQEICKSKDECEIDCLPNISITTSTLNSRNVESKDNEKILPKKILKSHLQNKCVGINESTTNRGYKLKNKTVKSHKSFKPSYRSGSYAILVALLNHYNIHKDNDNIFITKEELIEKAQPFSEESFIRPKPNTFYTAWSNMSKLVKKGLVIKVRKKKIGFKLSDEGVILAKKLLDENLSMPSTNDLINKNIINLQHSNMNHSYNPSIDNINNLQHPNMNNNSYNPSKENQLNQEKQIIDLDSDSNQEMLTENDSSCKNFCVGSFDVVLLIDKKESTGITKKTDPTVAQFNKYPDLKYEFRHLTVGDFTWIARHKINRDQELVLPYIVERKRMDDLGHSIKDGRFHEQKFRLKKCGIPNVFYLIERYGNDKYVGLPIQHLMQAIANTRVQNGFKVHIAESFTHAVRFLAMMTKRLDVEYKNKSLIGKNQLPINTELMTFTFFNTTSSKTKPLTVTETFIKLLLQLKGVSVEKALAITGVYKTPRSLIVAYSKCSEKEGETLLSSLREEGSSKKVGPTVSKNIFKLFTAK